jgi:hypothetical protein
MLGRFEIRTMATVTPRMLADSYTTRWNSLCPTKHRRAGEDGQ